MPFMLLLLNRPLPHPHQENILALTVCSFVTLLVCSWLLMQTMSTATEQAKLQLSLIIKMHTKEM